MTVPTFQRRCRCVPEIHGLTSATVQHTVLQLAEERLPLPFGDSVGRFFQANREGFGEQGLQRGRTVELPAARGGGLVGIVGQCVASVLRVEDEDGRFAVDFAFGGQVPAAAAIFQFAVQRVMPYPQLKQQHRQRMQIGFRRGGCFIADEIGSHVLHRAPDLTGGVAIDSDVVVIADQDLAGARVEHQVAFGDVAITHPAQVQHAIAVGHLKRDLAQFRQSGLADNRHRPRFTP